MKIGLFTYVHLDESELLDFNLLHHYIKYYLKQGIPSKNITIIPYGYKNFEKNYDTFKLICNQYKIFIRTIENFQYNFIIAHDNFLKWQQNEGIKFDWLVKTDIDEFMSYGCHTLEEYIYFLNFNNYDWASGYLIDCIDKEHILKPVDKNEDIFLQFPKRLFLTKKIINAFNYKAVAFRPKNIINVGHHECIDKDAMCHFKSSNRVYHFKWLDNIKYRIVKNKTREIFKNHEWANKEIDNTESIIKGDKLII